MTTAYTLAIIALLAINVGIGYAILKTIQRCNTLMILFAPKKPGYRRSGAIIRLPHINYGYGDDESPANEA